MNAVELFVRAAMDRESDGWDVPDGLGPDEFVYIDCFVSVDTETGEIIYGGREKQERRAKTSESGE